MVKLANTTDLKSVEHSLLWVQVPPVAPFLKEIIMFVFETTRKAIENSNDPYIGVVLFVGLVICVGFFIFTLIKK